MSLKDLKIMLESFQSNPNFVGELNCCRKNKDKYDIKTPHLDGSEIPNELLRITLDELEKYEIMNIESYNPLGVSADAIEECDVKDFQCVESFLEKLENDIRTPGNIDPIDIYFFVYKFYICDEKNNQENVIYIMRRHNRLKNLRKGFWARFSGGEEFKKISSNELVGIDSQIDLLIYNNKMIIFNHFSFERIFDISNEFIELATKVLKKSELREKILNYDEFVKDLLDNLNYVKRISKLDENKSFAFIDNIPKTKAVVKKLKLKDIIIDENNMFHYTDKSQLGEYVNLMQDAYYETLIGGENGIDFRR